MENLREGDVVTISVKVTDKSGKTLEGAGTVILVSGNEVAVLLPSGEIWRGPAKCVYPYQPT